MQPSLDRGAHLSLPQLLPAGAILVPGCSLTSWAAAAASNLVQNNPPINLFVIGHFRRSYLGSYCKWGGKRHDSWLLKEPDQHYGRPAYLIVTPGELQSPERRAPGLGGGDTGSLCIVHNSFRPGRDATLCLRPLEAHQNASEWEG